MLKTTSRPFVRAHARMFSASCMLVAKIVDAIPNWKLSCVFASACIASMVWQALSKPRFTSRTWLCTSPMPSSETRMLIRMPLLRAELDDAGEHRDGALGRQAGGVDADLAQPRQVAVEQLHHLGQVVPGRRLAAGDVEVLDRAPERVVMTGSSWASVMSDLRSPHFQLLHIVHLASQTQVQL